MLISPERTQFVFEKLDRDLRRLQSARSAESVHGFRTTTRRLQTLLEELMPERNRNQKKLLKLLARLRKRAGKVRDLDVQLAALRSLKIPEQPRRKTQLMQGLIGLRAEQERKLAKALATADLRQIRKRLRRASKETELKSGRDPLSVARRMLAEIILPAEPMSEDVLHQYRTLVKRARYAAEFASKSAESARFITQMKRLQDAIGNWHDWLTLTQTAAHRLGDVNQSPLVASLHNVTGGKFRQATVALSSTPTIQAAVKEVGSPKPSRKAGAKAPTLTPAARSAA